MLASECHRALLRIDEELGFPRWAVRIAFETLVHLALSQPHGSCQRAFPLSAFALEQRLVEFSREERCTDLTLCGQVTAGGQ